MKLLLDDGDEHVGGHGAPDLRLHGVLAVAEELLDAQVLLDPLEEQLDLPAALVQRGDRQRRQGRVVGQEDQRLARLGILEADAPQVLGQLLAARRARDLLGSRRVGRRPLQSQKLRRGLHPQMQQQELQGRVDRARYNNYLMQISHSSDQTPRHR